MNEKTQNQKTLTPHFKRHFITQKIHYKISPSCSDLNVFNAFRKDTVGLLPKGNIYVKCLLILSWDHGDEQLVSRRPQTMDLLTLPWLKRSKYHWTGIFICIYWYTIPLSVKSPKQIQYLMRLDMKKYHGVIWDPVTYGNIIMLSSF